MYEGKKRKSEKAYVCPAERTRKLTTNKVQGLESEMAGELTNLLNLVEKALEMRQKTVAELSLNRETSLPPPPPPPTQANSTNAPACDEVLI
ncbi:hypothetical protein ACTXT7_011425 [Hymenolepis weldensis]